MKGSETISEAQRLLNGGGDFVNKIIYEYAPKVLVALIVLWVGLKLIKMMEKALNKVMEKRKADPSLTSFVISLCRIALKVILFIAVLGMIGIETTSFIAVLGAAGLAVGMALQGTLQNFAGGVMVLLFKPYRVGDYISSGGVEGTVVNIQIFNTIIHTADAKEIIVPNTDLATKTLVNYSRSEERRVDISVGIAYGASVDKARQALLEVAASYPLVLTSREPIVVVTDLADSAVNLQLRVWVKNTDYWTAFFHLNQAVYEKLNEVGIEIPFNQMDVHVINHN